MREDYQSFVRGKQFASVSSGFDVDAINPALFPFQSAIVRWACKRGRAAIFANTGLGKTAMQCEWARQVRDHTQGSVLIVAPLCVAQQTVAEAAKFGVDVLPSRSMPDLSFPAIYVTNYEMIDHFDVTAFSGIVLDESSILKNRDGKTRRAIIESCRDVPYKLSCTATPSPNDHMELGNQAEFLGVMGMAEMLAMFFTHDGGETSKWRLKGHGKAKFWEWLATWSVCIRKPSDLGFDDHGYNLPPFIVHEHMVESPTPEGQLFPEIATTLTDRRQAKRDTLEARVRKVADVVNASGEQWLVWCHLNDEQQMLSELIDGAVSVAGADSIEQKESRMMAFTNGHARVLITKPSIAGFGMNWQHCSNMAFVGLDDSYEQQYQAIRRCWRFGQTRQVNVHFVTADALGAIKQNVDRKESQMQEMQESMVAHMRELTSRQIEGATMEKTQYQRDVASGEDWTLHLGDCVDVIGEMPEGQIDYTIFSPPFASLYTYSNSDYDMGNTKSHDEFYKQFEFLVDELYRVTRPGRLLSFHCMNLPTSKQNDGYIGIRDFRGELIRLFQSKGWIYHSEVCIWKDPVTAMQRTKALGLLHKTIRKDSAMSRQGIPDYLVTMRKLGENDKPISHTHDEFPVEMWQRYASPVWMDINPSRTLQHRTARDSDDERHICPLQLDVIERAVELWSAPEDLVLSPFAGIGSEGWVSLQMGRKFIGAELKPSYWRLACQNLKDAASMKQNDLFASAG